MKFTQYEPQIVSEAFEEIATEGWGLLLAQLGQGGTGIPITAGHHAVSISNLKKLLENKDLRKYLVAEAKKILADVRKSDKGATEKLDSGVLSALKKWWHDTDNVGSIFNFNRFAHWRSDWFTKLFMDTKIENFEFTFFYDTNHIQACVVILKAGDGSYFGRRIPAPTKSNLAKVFKQE